MKATEIERVPFANFDDSLVKERHELATKAQQELGYSQLAEVIKPVNSLFSALRKLGIEPLNSMSVERYKVSKERTFMRKSTWQLAVVWLLGLPFSIGPFISLAWYMHVHDFKPTMGIDSPSVGMVVGDLFLVIFAVIGVSMLSVLTWDPGAYRTPRKIRRWRLYPLSGFKGHVPEYVIERALQIRKEHPATEFLIEQLVTEVDARDEVIIKNAKERMALWLRDPFLIAKTKTEQYYIDVWDEKEYERTL